MDLGDLASTSVVEIVLLIGGLLAVASAVVGHKKERLMDDFLVVLGFIAGAVIIVVGLISLTSSGKLPISTVIILFALGLGLFLHLIKKIKIAALIALIIGIAVGYLLYQASKAYNLTGYLTPTVIVIIAFVIMIIIYVMLKFFEDLISIAGGILSFRPVMFIVGLLAILEAVLLMAGSSLSDLLK
ncbi:MAG: hypothetical protein A4E32_01798 [Methanomassiliicoccales archaeon PtaU1.Bin124]|nr:MAG: hypothetical protein A4E32_01798 [Methanomassiliicoccales archaeon PtaU1.Bin124]